jgi:hypothetical protein
MSLEKQISRSTAKESQSLKLTAPSTEDYKIKIIIVLLPPVPSLITYLIYKLKADSFFSKPQFFTKLMTPDSRLYALALALPNGATFFNHSRI